MYNGFELARNEALQNTYIGTIDADDFADDFVDKQSMDIGLICYKQIVISEGTPYFVTVYYEPDYTEDGAFNGYLEVEESDES